MSISTQSAAYITTGPAKTGQVLVAGQLSLLELAYIGTATFTGDGSTTTATLNYIDGTQALNWTPTAIFAARVGGNDTAAGLPYIVDAGNSNKTATVTFTTAPASGKTQTVAFMIMK